MEYSIEETQNAKSIKGAGARQEYIHGVFKF